MSLFARGNARTARGRRILIVHIHQAVSKSFREAEMTPVMMTAGHCRMPVSLSLPAHNPPVDTCIKSATSSNTLGRMNKLEVLRRNILHFLIFAEER